MKSRALLLCLALAAATFAAPGVQADDEYLLRVVPGTIGDLEDRLDLEVESAVGDPDGALFVVEIEDDEGPSLDQVLADPDVVAVEAVVELDLASIGHFAPTGADPAAVEPALADPSIRPLAGTDAWVGYLDQLAFEQIDLADAAPFTGAGQRIAIIDSGIDPNHPLLAPALLPGYDFVLDRPGASELEDVSSSIVDALVAGSGELGQSTVAILGQSTVAILGQSTVAILGQSTVAILGGLPPTFGHGTMVAGLVRRVAPEADILPLKVFTAQGVTTTAWLVRAVYHALDQGATVLNLSFTLSADSAELAQALSVARARGVSVVAAAGNAASSDPTMPAVWPGVIGVASVGLGDTRSPFSNHGDDFVDLAAPGEGLITTFPGGGYAAAWGTSFSAPVVSGSAALAQSQLPELAGTPAMIDAVEERLRRALPLPGYGLGAGRLDLEEALAVP